MRHLRLIACLALLASLAWGQKQSASQTVTIAIGSNLSVSTTALKAGVEGSGYIFTLAGSGGTSPYSWSATGLPAGLSVAASSGIVSGTITDNGCTSNTPQSITVSATLKDASGSTVLALLPMNLVCKLKAVAPAPQSGTVGVPYSLQLAATGGNGSYTWSSTGSLPAGLSLAFSTGLISGTPSAVGSSSFTVTVMDQTDQVAQWEIDLKWNASKSPAVVAYDIYRSDGGPWLSIGSTPSTTFADFPTLRNVQFSYLARAKDSSGRESGDSNQAAARVP